MASDGSNAPGAVVDPSTPSVNLIPKEFESEDEKTDSLALYRFVTCVEIWASNCKGISEVGESITLLCTSWPEPEEKHGDGRTGGNADGEELREERYQTTLKLHELSQQLIELFRERQGLLSVFIQITEADLELLALERRLLRHIQEEYAMDFEKGGALEIEVSTTLGRLVQLSTESEEGKVTWIG
ncbi:Hypothetical protein D9617_7g030700 [Elsinoe fawcettii]|nr:Hypothetical protein D9617_7g030700 [Elsinoe fawcettii]